MLQPSKFLDDKSVKEPTNDELKQFFDKYKDIESSPDSSQPGFRVPRKVIIEYLESDPENFESQVTDADITKEYEKDPTKYAREKEDFEKEEKEERDAREKEDKAAAAAKAATKTAPETKPSTELKSKEPTPPTKLESHPATGPAAKPENKSDAAPASKSTASPPAKPEVKQEATPAAGKAPEPAKPASTAAKPAGTSSAAPASLFRLVAYVDDKSADKTPKAATEQKAAEIKQPAAEAKTSANSGVKPEAVKKAGETKPAETKSAAELDKKDAANSKEERLPIKTAEERLHEYIRKELAGTKYQESVAKVKKTLSAYREKWLDAGDEKPKPPDFAVLAKKYNMTGHRTGLVSVRQLLETDFGKSGSYNAEAGRAVSVLGEVFGPTTLYKVGESLAASTSRSGKLVYYFFWKTDDQAGGVPKWDDKGIQDKVREEWKLIQARKPAMNAAEDLKKKAGSTENGDKSLKSLAAGDKRIAVVKPPRFTWMTSGMLTGQQPAISEVGDLEKPGEDFMKTVFSLSPGQVAVATNRSKSEVYVIRMISLTSFKNLWEQFISEDTTPEYVDVMRYAIRRDVDPAWRAKVIKDADYKIIEKKPSEGKSAPRPDAPEGPPPPEEY